MLPVSTSPNRLRELRLERGLSQVGLAAQAGVGPGVINSAERWGYRPTEAIREKLAAALDVNVDAIWPRIETAA